MLSPENSYDYFLSLISAINLQTTRLDICLKMHPVTLHPLNLFYSLLGIYRYLRLRYRRIALLISWAH